MVSLKGIATEEKYPEQTCGIYTRLGFEADVQAFKAYMRQRIQWLDEQFATTEQIVSSLYKTESAKPYTKATEQLAMTLKNTTEDSISEKLLADGVLYENTDYVYCVPTGKTDDNKYVCRK